MEINDLFREKGKTGSSPVMSSSYSRVLSPVFRSLFKASDSDFYVMNGELSASLITFSVL